MTVRFEELNRKISPTLKRIARRLNQQHAFFDEEELYQEALAHLWGEWCRGTLDDKTDSYILQGCFFHLKNYLRMHRERNRLVSIEGFAAREEEDGCRREGLYLQDEKSLAFRQELDDRLLAETIMNNGLTVREKHILCLYAQGFTTRQIGSRIGVSHVRVVKLMAGIREKCKRYLEAP